MKAIKMRSAAAAGTAIVFAALCAAALPARAQTQLLQNGGFEAGEFSSAWTTVSLTNPGNTSGFFVADNTPSPVLLGQDGGGNDVVIDAPITPVNGFPTVGAKSGDFYAVSDADGPASNALLQTFTVPINATQVTVSFSMFVNARNGAGALNTNGTLDYTQAAATQFARVDLLTANAGAFSLGAGSVVRNFYTGVDANAAPYTLSPIPYRTYSFDITGFALAGQTYQIRFADVGNRQVLNTGVDDVSILAIGPSAGAPEPASAVLLIAGAALWAAKMRKEDVVKKST